MCLSFFPCAADRAGVDSSVDSRKLAILISAALPAALDALRLEVEDASSPMTLCPASIIARKRISAFSWGEIIRINLNRSEPDGTELRVLTERVLATNMTARGDWSEQIHQALLTQLTESDSSTHGVIQ